MKIAFLQELLCIRGSSVALYDYADQNEKILGNQSIILLPESGISRSDPLGLIKFLKRFSVLVFRDSELEKILAENQVDFLYVIKYGRNEGLVSKKVRTGIHCVFDMSEPHGDVYAGVSREIAEKYGKKLFVPHMVSLRPDNSRNLRKKLNIPENATVFGRYGGIDTFNLHFCWEMIFLVLKERTDVYFLFINTPKIIQHSRVIYLEKIFEDVEKNEFISTCDAHLECGTMGHSFGLAIGEFSVNNKPIIAYKDPEPEKSPFWNGAHLAILGDKGIYFSDALDFYRVISSFKREDYIGPDKRDLNCYKAYSPKKVMEQFKKVFLE